MSTENDIINLKSGEHEFKGKKNFLKKYFVAGLFLILPLWLTALVIVLIFNWTSGFSMPYLLPLFKFFISDKSWVYLLAKVSSFFLTLVIIWSVGFFTTKLIGKKIFSLLEELLSRIPLFGSIYASLKKLMSFFSSNDKKMNFQKVVFIPFCNKESYCMAFATGEKIINGKKYVTVFMPTTPNPTTGFLILIKEEDVLETNFTVEEAIAYIISGGILIPPGKAGPLNCNLEKKNGDL
ncbi:MAG: DUF502 domain-containing protein [Endomicrobiaceae bacterium]